MTTDLKVVLQRAAAIPTVPITDEGVYEARRRGRQLRRRRQAWGTSASVLLVLVAALVVPGTFDDDGRARDITTVSPADPHAPDDGADTRVEVGAESGARPEAPSALDTRSGRESSPASKVGTASVPAVPGTGGLLGPGPPPPPQGDIARGPGTLAFVRGNDIYLRTNGSDVRLTQDATFERHRPSWSPDGRRLVYSRSRQPDATANRTDTMDAQDLWVVDVATKTERLLFAEGDHHAVPTWLPDGRGITFRRSTSFVLGAWTNGATWVIDEDGTNPRPWEHHSEFAYSADGRSVAYSCTMSLCVADADFGNERVVPNSEVDRDVYTLAWSPDGRSLAAGGSGRFLRIDVDGSNRRLIVDQGGTWPTWANNGSSIVFTGSTCLAAVDADGGNLRCLPGEADDRYPAFSPPRARS